MSASADITQLLEGIRRGGERAIAAALKAVDQFGQHVLGDAQQLTPVKTGALKASGSTEPAEVRGGVIGKRIGFGVFYAIFVHERLDLHHAQGQAKFLETAIRNNATKFAPFVAAAVAKVL